MSGAVVWLEGWWSTAIAVSLQAGVLILGVAAVGLLFRLSARARFGLWCAVAIRLLVPLAIDTPIGVLPGPTPERLSAPALPVEALPSTPSTPLASTALGGAAPSAATGAGIRSTLLGVAFALWAAGVAALAVRRLRHQRQLGRSLAASRRADAELEGWTRALWSTLGGRGRVRLRVSAATHGPRCPFVVGLIRPTVVVPAALVASWSRRRLEPVLLHELIHVRRRDPLWSALLAVVETIYFFHPLIALATARARLECEYACDDEVARRVSSSRGYADSLVRLATPRGRPALPPALALSSQSHLLRRVRRLVEPDPPYGEGSWRRVLGALAFGGILVLAAGRSGLPTAGVGQDGVDLTRWRGPGDETVAEIAAIQELGRRCDDRSLQRLAELLVDLTTEHPDLEQPDAVYLTFVMPEHQPELYRRLRGIWLGHLDERAGSVAVLVNAAAFFSLREPRRALELLTEVEAVDPGRPQVALAEARLHLRLAEGGDGHDRRLGLSLASFEAAVARSPDPAWRLFVAADAAYRLSRTGALGAGGRFARRALAMATEAGDTTRPGRNKAVHYARIALGREALASGDEQRAIGQLMLSSEAASAAGSKGLYVDLDLARELLDRGHRVPVARYLDRCRLLWPKGEADFDETVASMYQQLRPLPESSPPTA